MNRLLLLCGILLSANHPVWSGTYPVNETPVVTLRVYNRASVPSKVLMEARAQIMRIFAPMGIDVRWAADSNVTTDTFQTFTLCIVIVDGQTAEVIPHTDSMMGFTPDRANANEGFVAYVFYDQIRSVTLNLRLSSSLSPTDAQILAFTILHETGHLLLPVTAHSKTGIMRAKWEPEDFKNISRGGLRFTDDQVDLLTAAIRKRSAIQRR